MHGSLLLKLLGVSFAHPLDGGARLFDGQPLFGRSKTIRGIVLTAGGCLVGAVLTGSLIPAVWHYLEMKDNVVGVRRRSWSARVLAA